MTFDEAMKTECGRCGKHASLHRMTANTFYCTILNAVGRSHYYRLADVQLSHIVYRTSVRNLQHSDLTGGVRDAIKGGLTSFA